MPGIKRARPKSSYFSGTSLDLSWTFSRSKSVSRQRERSKSIEFLASPQLDSSRRAQSSRDISSDYEREQIELNKLQIERELELKVQSLGNLLDENSKKYKEVTVPVTIKFSVYEDSDKKQSRMARSRSPSSSFSNTELLDQTLINIRKKLVSRRTNILTSKSCMLGWSCKNSGGVLTVVKLCKLSLRLNIQPLSLSCTHNDPKEKSINCGRK